ncbi:MAG: glycosyltransferase, partial [Nitrospinota bacterium]
AISNAVSKNKKTVHLETHTVSQILTRPKPANIWMDYTYYPVTTAHYLRRAFEADNRVVTSGSSITPEIIEMWNLKNMKAPIVPQDIPRTKAQNAFSIIAEMPKGFKPEFFFWVDTGIGGPPAGIEKLPIKKAAYLIDTHRNTERDLQMAAMFDVVFLAQREYVDMFRQKGIRSVHWLPLACDPEIHGKRETQKKYDIGFVGSITPASVRRVALLEKLAAQYNVGVNRVFLEEMAGHFSASKIVFNNAIKNDLNMRVFEALCSGSMLLTDDADGLSDFFEDGKHLVVFNDENITELAGRYLENEKERETIASAGRTEVLKRHTYFHRAQKIIETMRAERDSITIDIDQSYYHHVRPEIMEMAPESAKRILDVGCAAGEVGARLKEMNPEREVVGVEFNPKAAENAAKLLDKVFVGNVERLNLPYEDGYFDCIIYADVLEHLHEPEKVIMKHKRLLAPGGVMVMSIPNTRHYSLVNHLIEGRWTYIDQGLLDRTHLRFFTLYEIRRMLARCGLKSIEIKGKQIDDLYKDGASGLLRIGRWQIDNLTPEEMTEFFVFQYIIKATPDPNAVSDKDVTVPEYFYGLIKSADRFKEGANDASDTVAGMGRRVAECTDHAEAEELAIEIDSMIDAGAFDGEGEKLWAGHFNMALSRFDEAEKIYRGLGDMKFVGCAFAARGLMMDALSHWWEARDDSDVENWLMRYSSGALAPERVALKAAQEGSGICLEAGTKQGLNENLDFITSLHALENSADPVKTIAEWRKALRPGGVLALVCADVHAQPDDIQPPPLHRFTHEGLNSLIELAGGFASLCTNDIYKGRSFVAVYQKEGGKKGAVFDYENRLKKLLSETAYHKSLEYWEANNLPACMQAAAAAIALNPKNGDAVTKLGDCLLKRDKAEEASLQYQWAMKISESEAPHIGMGTIYLSAQDFESAQREFEKAVKLNPKNDRAVCGLGMAYFHAGKEEEGFNEYKKALELNPENGTALSALLQASYAMKRLDEAESALEKFLELHPANLDILFGLAGVLYATQKFTQAKDVLERILALSPKNADATALYEKTLKEEVQTKK